MKVLLDTSCLVAFFLNDAHYNKARAVLESILEGETQGVISALSFAELCGAIRRNAGEGIAKAVKDKVAGLIEKGFIEVVQLKAQDAYASGDLAISTGLRGADAVIVNAARENAAKLFTFDEEIRKKGRGYVEFI
ncbi:MAG: type II toxin-antitoxin system VapC family toxin [Candidatus Aenigmarchaeota archaeon]|nr:type II toxin-antitoxin system VapC family toxin [Candidatus Aenigmarchaeota archaeon]